VNVEERENFKPNSRLIKKGKISQRASTSNNWSLEESN